MYGYEQLYSQKEKVMKNFFYKTAILFINLYIDRQPRRQSRCFMLYMLEFAFLFINNSDKPGLTGILIVFLYFSFANRTKRNYARIEMISVCIA